MLTARGETLIACLCFLAVLKIVNGQIDLFQYEDELLGEHPRDANYNFTERVGKLGYKAEEHTVITKDGYILTVFRIPKGKNCYRPVKKPPLLLIHGLLMTSDSWLDAGPSAGLAYLLADACYDLWVGNVRGNYYGRRHVRLDPDSDAEFWKFSTHEMGTFDLPAIIDYVLNYTKSPDLLYVGFSQGSKTIFMMCSETAGYCDKIRVSIHLAPPARMKYTRSILSKLVFKIYATLAPTLKSPATLETLPKGGPVQTIVSNICRFDIFANSVCKLLLSLLDSYDPKSISTETVKKLYDSFPGGTSAYNMAFYGQHIISERFQKYDYGTTKNLEMYGDAQPPLYNLSRVIVPVVLIYGKNDFLVDPRDVSWLTDQLPNLLETYEVTRPTWNHLDVCYSRHTKLVIFPKINEYLKKYSYV